MENVAAALDGDIPWSDLIGSYAPSWRWREFGEHDPTPESLRSDRAQDLLNEIAAARDSSSTTERDPE